MEKLRVGIAGYGVVGKRRRHYIDQHPNLVVKSVCDRIYSDTPALKDKISYYASYQELLEEELDVLFVCLTNDIASEVTMAGLRKNLHVFCEKPPGRTVADVLEVMEVEADCAGLKLKYGFNHRYHDSIMRALEVVQKGELGKVINLRGVYGKSKMINFDSDWRTQREVAGGGILLDQGIHMIDMMRLFAGDFVEIHSIITNGFWKHDVEDNAYALMKSKAGIVAMLHSSATQWRHLFHLDIHLEQGAITLSGILSGSKSYGAETITVSYASENDCGDPLEETIRYNTDNSWAREIADFTECILKDKEVGTGSSVDALQTMKLLFRIYCADEHWKTKYNIAE